MRITVVCMYCRYHDNDPNIELHFKEGRIHYVCKECKKENIINLLVENKPFPRSTRLR